MTAVRKPTRQWLVAAAMLAVAGTASAFDLSEGTGLRSTIRVLTP